MHSANDVVHDQDLSRPVSLADTYNVVSNSIALNVALGVARLFDVSDHRRFPIEQQDKASVPVLAHLLMRQDVKDYLGRNARSWPYDPELAENDCRKAVAAALDVYERCLCSSVAQEALVRVRQFRTGRLAHHLFDKQEEARPLYDHLNLLADLARSFVRPAVLAIEGVDRDLARQEEIKRKLDTRFWHLALSASLTQDE